MKFKPDNSTHGKSRRSFGSNDVNDSAFECLNFNTCPISTFHNKVPVKTSRTLQGGAFGLVGGWVGVAQELLMSDCDSRGGVTGQQFKAILWFV